MSQRHRDLAKHKTNTNVGGTAGADKFLGDLQVKAHRRSARLAEDDAQLAFINDEMNRINDKKDALKAKFAKDTMYRDEMRATIKIVKDTLQKVRLSRPHPAPPAPLNTVFLVGSHASKHLFSSPPPPPPPPPRG